VKKDTRRKRSKNKIRIPRSGKAYLIGAPIWYNLRNPERKYVKGIICAKSEIIFGILHNGNVSPLKINAGVLIKRTFSVENIGSFIKQEIANPKKKETTTKSNVNRTVPIICPFISMPKRGQIIPVRIKTLRE
jgi:hypothetical protein